MSKMAIRLDHAIIPSSDGVPPEIAVEGLGYDVGKYQTVSVSTDENDRPWKLRNGTLRNSVTEEASEFRREASTIGTRWR